MRFKVSVVAFAVSSLAFASAAQARTFEVTRQGDPVPGNCGPNDCSLREAVRAANARPGPDKIVLPSRRKPYRLAQAGTLEDGALTGDLDVTNDGLAFVHPGGGRATVDALGIDRVIEVFDGAPVRFVKLRIRGGNDTSGNGGGGVRTDANATFTRSVLSGNVSSDIGGGVDGDDDANLVLNRSRVSGNTADVTAGGVGSPVDGRLVVKRSKVVGNEVLSGGAGGVQFISAVGGTIKQSTVAENESSASGGGVLAVVNTTPSTLKIIASTISGNEAAGDAGGILVADGQTVRVTNSTIAGNRALDFGGGMGVFDDSDVTLNAATIARNHGSADDTGVHAPGGGIFRNTTGTVSVRNTIIALNRLGTEPIRNDCGGEVGQPFDSLGNNLLSVTSSICNGFDEPGDRVRSNPKLGKLKRNGGPTKTVALKRGSPAIGRAHKPSAPNRDQRGRKRDKNPDVGAFER